ncbi:MAG: HAD-IB family hydrolase [Mycobacteriaceae bacterium]|nr:HAD-IB family hydrolase [Mycobacteriaceae bacterium]
MTSTVDSAAALAAAVQRVRTGPQGPSVGAFFDFDGTLVHGFTGVHFFRKLWRRGLSRRELAATLLDGIRGEKTEADVRRFSVRALRAWGGHTERELDEIGAQLFEAKIAGHLYPEAWQLVQAHERAGHTVVIASSASRFQVEPAAAELGVAHVLCTAMEVSDGVLTGRVAGPMRWGEGKAAAVRTFAAAHQVDLARSYGYSNGGEDVPLLSLVGVPVAVNPDHRLEPVAAAEGWPTLRFRPRPQPGPIRLARTVFGLTALVACAVAGALSGAPARNRMVARLMRWGSTAALRTTGVRVRVTGQRHAAAPRPAVFVFNHQSNFDPFVLAYVLGRAGEHAGGWNPVTGIAKRELVRNPVFGPLFRFAGVTFIDRGDTANAIAAMQPVVDTLRAGTSIAIAPEGHRSLSPRLLPFKKGAFHLAIQAGVPIVPVVVRNGGEIMWRNAIAVTPGTVDVAVLDPVDVSAWNPADMDADIERVRARMADTIANWP